MIANSIRNSPGTAIFSVIALAHLTLGCRSSSSPRPQHGGQQLCAPRALPNCPSGLTTISADDMFNNLETFVDRLVAIRGKVETTGCQIDSCICIPTCEPPIIVPIRYYLVTSKADTFFRGEIFATDLYLETLGGPACCPSYRLSTEPGTAHSWDVIATGKLRVSLDRREIHLDSENVCEIRGAP
jgi:hypothetical protein